MKLKGEKWENYSTLFIDNHKDDEWYKKYSPERLELSTCSVQYLLDIALWMKNNCELNHKNPDEVPVFVNFDNKKYTFDGFSCGHDDTGMRCEIRANRCDELIYTAPDSKPVEGEYWASRGPGYDDCSGFIKSKKAGERIQRMVNYILDKNETKSWLDFRENEPSWIQYKFSASEFDVELLDKMSNEAGGIVTEQILRKCALK